MKRYGCQPTASRVYSPWMQKVSVTAVALVMLGGCAGHACPRIEHTDPEQALTYHDSMREHARSLRAEARVDQFNRKGRVRGTVMMFVARPNRLRFDAMTQFGPAAVLTSDGPDFSFLDLRKKVFLQGPVCPSNIARLMGVAMKADDLALLLLAQVPRIRANSTVMQCTEDGFYRIVRYGTDGLRQEIDLDIREADLDSPLTEQRLRLLRVELYDPKGETEWRVSYDDYRVVRGPEERQGVAMPFSIRFVDPKRGGDTLVRFKTLELNVAIPSDVFRQQPPPGTSVRRATCP